MTRKKIKSAAAALLAAIILWTGLPVQAFATKDSTWADTDFQPSQGENTWQDITRKADVIKRSPLPYEEISGSDIDGKEISRDRNSITYLMEDDTYLTRYQQDPLTYTDEKGREKPVDNSLREKSDSYENTENIYELTLPKEGDGITIEKQGISLTMVPLFGNLQNPVKDNSSVRYTAVSDGIDLQYTAKGSGVKEDIILTKPIEKASFSYELKSDTSLRYTVEDNVLYAFWENEKEPLFTLAAPYMTDNQGEMSQAVFLEIEKNILTVTAADEWLNAAERAYPVIIDPVIVLNDSNLEYGFIENGYAPPPYTGAAGPDVSHLSNPYMYVGFEDGSLVGVGGITYGQTRSYIKIDYDFTQLPDNAIISASLKAFQYDDNVPSGTKINACYIRSPWKGTKKTWNNRPSEMNIIDTQDVSGKMDWVEWDISTAVREWKNGKPNYGIMLTPATEDQQAVVLSGPGNSHSSMGGEGRDMYFDISWTVPNAVDENLPLDKPDINLRPLTFTYSTGLQQLTGVFADGIVRPQLDVNYRLNNEDSGTYHKADYGRIYPESKEFEDEVLFNIGYTGLHESNWQSKLFKSFTYNKLYAVYAKASGKDGSTPEGKSDNFIVYRFREQDTLPHVAAYYGVTTEQLLKDNRPQDYLTFAGNTFFIRNPKKNAGVPYTRSSSLDLEHKRDIIYAAMGRGIYSEFDIEPVNMNIGNYYFESGDFTTLDLGEENKLSRSYNSMGSKTDGLFGRGWSFEYEQKLAGRTDGSMVYMMGDGKRLVFEKTGQGYKSPQGYDMTLRKNTAKKPENTTYSITDRDGAVYTFNCYGILTGIKESNGLATSISYDENYHIKSITTPAGRKYAFTVNDDGHVTSILTPGGGVLKYRYTGANLTSFVNADGEEVVYNYDDEDRMSSWKDGNGNVVIKNTYDSLGRVIKQEDAMGNISRLAYEDGKTTLTKGDRETVYMYDENFRTTSVTGKTEAKEVSYTDDGNLLSTSVKGISSEYSYDKDGNLIREERADGSYREVTYDEKGRAIRIRDFDGSITTNTYDSGGNLIKEKLPGGITRTYTYDSIGRITRIADGEGHKTGFDYVSMNKTVMTDPLGQETIMTYDAAGRLITEESPGGILKRTSYSKQGKILSTWLTGDIQVSYGYDRNGNLTEKTDPRGYGSYFTYDALNRMVTAKDPQGAVITYQYDENGNKIKEIDPLGNVTSYQYDSKGLLIKETDPLGNTLSYEYDDNGRLIREIGKNGLVTEYDYDDIYGKVIEKRQEDRVSKYEYDALGRLTKTIYPDGTSLVTEYDDAGNVIREVSPDGLETVYTYDKNGNMLTSEDSGGRKTSSEYDALGRKIKTVDALGMETVFEYDKDGNLIKETSGRKTVTYEYDSQGNITSRTAAGGEKTEYTYDKAGNVLSVTDPMGNITRFSYDGVSNLIAITDPEGAVTSYTYDKKQQLTSSTNAMGAVTRYVYDKGGRLIKTIDPEGNEESTEYDASGNAIAIKNSMGNVQKARYDLYGNLIGEESARGLITEYSYDNMDRMIRKEDSSGNSLNFEYDLAGRLLKETDAAGREKTYEYDIHGNLIKTVDFNRDTTVSTYDLKGRLISLTDPEGKISRYSYDGQDNLILLNAPEGTYSYEYDLSGNLIKETDPLGAATCYRYDATGNITEQTDAMGGKTTYTYSKAGRLSHVKDPLGQTTSYGYDLLGRLTKETSPEGRIREYAYDKVGNMTAEKDGDGYVTRYEYDSLGRLTEKTTPRGGRYTYQYDEDSNLILEKDPKGAATEYTYDQAGLLTSKKLPSGFSYTYLYDELGRPVKVSDSEGLWAEITYDRAGNATREKDQDGNETVYRYDGGHRVISKTDALGQTEEYTYDDLGNLSSIKKATGAVYEYGYDALGRLVMSREPGVCAREYAYDDIGRMTQQTQGEKVYTYEYDLAGNLIKETDPLGSSMVYSYDRDGLLTQITYPLGTAESYSYDGRGNITQLKARNGAVTTACYDGDGNAISVTDPLEAKNEYVYDLTGNLTQVKTPGSSVTYSYDKAGNMTDRVIGESVTEYSYDKRGQVTEVILPDKTSQSFSYDKKGRLEGETDSAGKTKNYDYDVLDRLLSKNDSSYSYDEAGRLTEIKDEYTYTYDRGGRVISVTDSAGRTVAYSYDEYGRVAELAYPDGQKAIYTYDLSDNIRSVEKDGLLTEYTYDKEGNLLTETRSDKTSIIRTYSEAGELLSLSNSKDGKEISTFAYTYDPMGRIVSETSVREGAKTEKYYEYDRSGQLSKCIEEKDGIETVTEYSYSLTGNRIAKISGSEENRIEYVYDEMGRLKLEKDRKNGNTRYTYDEAGNLIEKDGKTRTEYIYDDNGNLSAVREDGNLIMAALYDSNGNRIMQSVLKKEAQTLKGTDKWTEDENTSRKETATVPGAEINRSDVKTQGSEVKPSTWDVFKYGFMQGSSRMSFGAGQTAARIFSESLTPLWENMQGETAGLTFSLYSIGLTKEEVSRILGQTTTTEYSKDFEYDVVSYSFDTTFYVNDFTASQPQVLALYDIDGEKKESYTYGNDRIAGENEAYLYDGRGSVAETLTADGLISEYSYGPYGELKARNTYDYDMAMAGNYVLAEEGLFLRYDEGLARDSQGNPVPGGVSENFTGFGFNGEEQNQRTGLQYLRTRYYDSQTGSFISMDTYEGDMTSPISQNRYTYAENDPIGNFDPSGHFTVKNKGISRYVDKGDINELRAFMQGAAMYQGAQAANGNFYGKLMSAQATNFMNYASISGISQSTANCYIEQGITDAAALSLNYGCSRPVVSADSAIRYAEDIYASRQSVNEKIYQIKENKRTEYENYIAYQEYLMELARWERLEKMVQATYTKAINAIGKTVGMLMSSFGQKPVYTPVVSNAGGNPRRQMSQSAREMQRESFPINLGDIEYLIKGNYYEGPVRLQGVALQILAGVSGADFPMDIRDIYYDVSNFEMNAEWWKSFAIDAVAPMVGALKYTDEAALLVKYSKEFSVARKSIKGADRMPFEEYMKWRDESVKNKGSKYMTLGKYFPDENGAPRADSYTEIATKTGDTYFDLGKNWNKLEEKYGFSDDDMFKLFNIPALDDAVKAGKTIRFCHDPEAFKETSLYDEYIYLKTKYGYEIKQIGEYWYAK